MTIDYELAVKRLELKEWAVKIMQVAQSEDMSDADFLAALGIILTMMLRDEPDMLEEWIDRLRNSPGIPKRRTPLQ